VTVTAVSSSPRLRPTRAVRIVATAPPLDKGPHTVTVVNAWGVETPDGKQIQME
jgi:hypothetical protein